MFYWLSQVAAQSALSSSGGGSTVSSAATAVGVVSLSIVQNLSVTSTITAVSTATTSAVADHVRTAAITAVGNASAVVDAVKSAISNIATGVARLAKRVFLSRGAAATGITGEAHGLQQYVTSTTTATGAASESDVYIPYVPDAAGGNVLGVVLRKLLRGILTRIFRR